MSSIHSFVLATLRKKNELKINFKNNVREKIRMSNNQIICLVVN